MPDNKNALAELAERLKTYCKPLPRTAFDFDIETAQRIVAELAKVAIRNEGVSGMNALWNCNDCIARCREIAEEGENDAS